MNRRTALVAVSAVGTLVGAGVLVGLNPVAPPPATVRAAQADPQELLADPALTVAAGAGPWVAEPPGGLRPRRDGWARVRGTLRQEVPLTALAGRPYRLTVRLRAAASGGSPSSPVDGAVQVQTACSGPGEAARTTFRVGAAWRDVSATLTAARPEGCSLRVLVEAGSGPGLEVDRAALRVGALADPSFEAAAPDPAGGLGGPWQAVGLNVAIRRTGAVDGATTLQVTAGPGGGTLRQRVRLDASSEPVLARAELWVRSAGDRSVPVRLRVGRPCPSTAAGGDATAPAATATVTVPADGGWRRLVARHRVPRAGADGLPVEPPGIIRPDGVGCTVDLEVAVPAGASVLLDGADLRFTSLHPPSGSERYRRAVTEPVTGPTTPLDQRMGGSVDGAASAGGS